VRINAITAATIQECEIQPPEGKPAVIDVLDYAASLSSRQIEIDILETARVPPDFRGK
jgi:hypothetical protein